MPSNTRDPPQTPSKPNSNSNSTLLHHLTTSPPRPSYLSQKAHIFAIQTPSTTSSGTGGTDAHPSHNEERAADPQSAVTRR